MILNKLGDFNEVIDYYKTMIDLAKIIKPNTLIQYTMTPEKTATFAYYPAILRAIINSVGISISQNFEKINEKDGKYKVKEEDIIKAFEGKEYFKQLLTDNEMTPYEVVKQIRNCLVHGEYDIEFQYVTTMDNNETFANNKLSNINVVFNNGKFNGRINALEIKYLEYIYSDLYTFYSNKSDTYFLTGNRKFESCKNNYFLENYLKSLKKYIIQGNVNPLTIDDNIDSIIDQMIKNNIISYDNAKKQKEILQNIKEHSKANFFELFEQKDRKTEETKEFIKKYLKYIGLSNYEYLMKRENPYIRQMFIEDVFQGTFGERSGVDLISTYCDLMYIYMQGLTKEHNAELDIKRMYYEGPIIYANMLLGLGNYSCVFLKEVNTNEKNKDISIFEYHNLEDINGLQIEIDDFESPSIVYDIPGNEKLDKINNEILNYQSTIQTYTEKIKELNKKKSKLNNKNPKKEELEKRYDLEIKQYNEKIEKCTDLIKRLKIRENDYFGKYNDYTNLFRHIRNSIAHGTYEIDYFKALENKNLEKIKFTFLDYSLENKTTPEFKLEITAEQFMKLIQSVQNKVNKQLKKEKSENLIISNHIRHTNEDFESRVGEDALIRGLIGNLLLELTESKEKGRNK